MNRIANIKKIKHVLFMLGIICMFCSSSVTVYAARGLCEGSMPAVGPVKTAAFYITFENAEPYYPEYSKETVYEFLYDINNPKSVRSFYNNASYGRMEFSGQVYEYQAKDINSYSDTYEIMTEVLEYYSDIIDFSQLDSDQDGYMDGLYFIYDNYPNGGRTRCIFWDYQIHNCNNYICAEIMPDGISGEILAHETCHMMGLPDIYAGVSLNPSGTTAETIMDQAGRGDLPGIEKYLLGWIQNPITISGTGSHQVKLNAISKTGSMAIVYPNGDSNSPYWFILEYVVPYGNDSSQGVRVWRADMTPWLKHYTRFDSPYDYLEAIHRDVQSPFYLLEGDTISPYTDPSTYYGSVYSYGEGFKIIADKEYSGISITVDSMDADSACLTVSIEPAADDIPFSWKNIQLMGDPGYGAFICNENQIEIARLSSDIELCGISAQEKIYLTDDTGEIVCPVSYMLDAQSKIIILAISLEDLNKINTGQSYSISYDSIGKTYYGQKLELPDDRSRIVFDKKPVILPKTELISNNNFNYFNSTVSDKYYEIGDGCVETIGFINQKGYMFKINVSTRETEIYELDVEENFERAEYFYSPMQGWILFGYYPDNRMCISAFDTEGIRTDMKTVMLPHSVFDYIQPNGDGHFSYQVSNSGDVYDISIVNGNIAVLLRGNAYDWPNDLDLSEEDILTKPVFWLNSEKYVICGGEGIRFIDLTKQVVNYYQWSDVDKYHILLQDNQILFATVNQDIGSIIVYTFDDEFQLLNKKTVISSLPECLGSLSDFRVERINSNQYLFTFMANDYSPNTISGGWSYSTTYFFITNSEFQITHYYVGVINDNSAAAYPVFMKNDAVFLGSDLGFRIVDTADDHSETTVITKESSCAAEGYRDVVCKKCGLVLSHETSSPDAHKYVYNEYIQNLICTECGTYRLNFYVDRYEHNATAVLILDDDTDLQSYGFLYGSDPYLDLDTPGRTKISFTDLYNTGYDKRATLDLPYTEDIYIRAFCIGEDGRVLYSGVDEIE